MSNTLFHNKYHLTNHHTVSTYGYPDSAIDPIASFDYPFLGLFHNRFNTGITSITATSFEWYSMYTTLSSNSAYYYLFPTTFATVNSLSSNWQGGYSFFVNLSPISAVLEFSYTLTRDNSANWPFLNDTLRLNRFQDYTAAKNFQGITLAPSIFSAVFYYDFVSPIPSSRLPGRESVFYSTYRGSSATFTDHLGIVQYSSPENPQRIDHLYNPVTQEWDVQGLLVEEKRTNVILYSHDYTQPSWNTNGTAVEPAQLWPVGPDDGIAPDNQSFACKVFLGSPTDALNTTHVGNPGDRYEPSFYIKNVSTTGIMHVENLEGQQWGKWLIDFAQLNSLNWNRITRNHPAVTVVYEFVVAPTTQLTLSFYYPTANLGPPEFPRLQFWFWGVQLEKGTFPTTIIPTFGSIYTRDTDFVFLSGDLLNNTEGTFLVETKLLGFSADHNMTIFRFFNESKEDEILLRYNKDNFTALAQGLIDNSYALSFFLPSDINRSDYIRTFGLSYQRNKTALADSGFIASVDNSALIPQNLSCCYIGISAFEADQYNGYIRRFGYFDQQLQTNALRLLTLSGYPYPVYDHIETYDWDLSGSQTAFIKLSSTGVLPNVANPPNKRKGGEYTLVVSQDPFGDHQLLFDTDYVLPKNLSITEFISPSSFSTTVIKFTCNGPKLYGKPTQYYYWLNEPYTLYGINGIILDPNPAGLYDGDNIAPQVNGGVTTFGNVPYYTGGGIIILYDGV